MGRYELLVLSYCPIVTHLHGISECGRVWGRGRGGNVRKINCTESLSLTSALNQHLNWETTMCVGHLVFATSPVRGCTGCWQNTSEEKPFLRIDHPINFAHWPIELPPSCNYAFLPGQWAIFNPPLSTPQQKQLGRPHLDCTYHTAASPSMSDKEKNVRRVNRSAGVNSDIAPNKEESGRNAKSIAHWPWERFTPTFLYIVPAF